MTADRVARPGVPPASTPEMVTGSGDGEEARALDPEDRAWLHSLLRRHN